MLVHTCAYLDIYCIYETPLSGKYAFTLLVLESEFFGVAQLVEGGIAGELQHGRRAAHQHDVVLGRREQALLNHGGVHATRAVQRYAKGWAQVL